MGIPKFFRWISERYPLTSQLITPNSIPTFDNLYLDMNGIIHNCSHPASSEGDAHFRMSEEQMVLAIFAYIDHLFTKIKPRKVFFMAVDGVAPRAKMNQQRSRRFRTAKEAKELAEKAERKGEKMPDEKAFDSNCITPGTPFMARLSKHLQYFVNKKITEDAEWRDVTVILSGHDVPGEGEHKIQEFIRLSKAQPEYNPNTRHCLYGLDADLIMLGLLSHDPHFCLLREEVTFGRKVKKNAGLASQNFFLLHLSLLREYLDLEFSSISEELPFDYDLERIIDDFILLSVFVGNDFLPHLPNLHIGEGAMEEIWGIYKKVLPSAGGYMNAGGDINTRRLQLVLDELAKVELEIFEKEYADLNWYKGKQQKEIAAMELARSRGKLVLTKDQKALFTKIKAFVKGNQVDPQAGSRLEFVNNFPARDRRFIQEISDALHLDLAWDEVDEYGQNKIVIMSGSDGSKANGVNGHTNGETEDGEAEGEEESSSEPDDESNAAIDRVLEKYSKAKVVDNTIEDFEESYESKLQGKLDEWKKGYYKEKLEFKDQAVEVPRLASRYIEGLQWVMNYYYKGVASWGWYYDYHYAPRISDLKGAADMVFEFEIGTPFRPFQQLMGVLPAASQEHIPLAYRDMMYDANSPILDFYPDNFEQDLNGKKQDWEAIVKIPFIDEKRLLKAMASRDHRLTPEEQSRNQMGVLSTQFSYDEEKTVVYPSSLPGTFPDIAKCKCQMDDFELPELGDGIELISGLLSGVQLGASALAGFPSTKTLGHHAQLGYHSVNVHGSDSRNPSMVITVENAFEGVKGMDVAAQTVGQRTFLYWPFLQEGLVVGVSDDLFKYERRNGKLIQTPHDPSGVIQWKKKGDRIEGHYSKRFGVITGNVDILLHVRPLKGLKRMDDGALIKDYEGPEKETEQAVQMAVQQVTFEDERYLEQDAPPVGEEFPVGTRVVFLGSQAYGAAAQVTGITNDLVNILLAFFPTEAKETETYAHIVRSRPAEQYNPGYALARQLQMTSLALSRITSSLLVELEDGSKLNIGLSLKNDAKGQKVMGYSKKNDRGWEYSRQAVELVRKYKAAFPDVFVRLDTEDRAIARSHQVFPNDAHPDAKIKEVRAWLKAEGVLNLDTVNLFEEQLERSTVAALEKSADEFNRSRSLEAIKKVKLEAIPRQAVLKPSHALYRLQGQTFALGDRIVMAQDAAVGGVSLGMKGIVIGVNTSTIDVVWDVSFMGGETLSGRCSEHRGSSVPFSSCLNLSKRQFAVTSHSSSKPIGAAPAFKPKLGPAPAVPSQHFRPSTAPLAVRPQVAIMANPRTVRPANFGHAVQGIVRPVQRPPVPNAKVPHAQALRGALLGRGGGVGRPPMQPHVTLMVRPPTIRPAPGVAPALLPGAVVPLAPGPPPAPAPGVSGPVPHIRPVATRGRGGPHRGGRGRGGMPRGGGAVRPVTAA